MCLGLVAERIGAACWFTASTPFANPAITVARSVSDTFAGIRSVGAPVFIAAQPAGGPPAGAGPSGPGVLRRDSPPAQPAGALLVLLAARVLFVVPAENGVRLLRPPPVRAPALRRAHH